MHQEVVTKQLASTPLFTTLIQLYTKFKDLSIVLDLYNTAIEKRMVNCQLYNSILTACLDLGDIDKAKTIHKDIISNGISKTLPLYNTLLKLYSKCGDMDKTQELWLELKQHFKPDVFSYTSMITVCANARDLTRGQQVLQFKLGIIT